MIYIRYPFPKLKFISSLFTDLKLKEVPLLRNKEMKIDVEMSRKRRKVSYSSFGIDDLKVLRRKWVNENGEVKEEKEKCDSEQRLFHGDHWWWSWRREDSVKRRTQLSLISLYTLLGLSITQKFMWKLLSSPPIFFNVYFVKKFLTYFLKFVLVLIC